MVQQITKFVWAYITFLSNFCLNKFLELHNMAKNICEKMSRLDETYIDVSLPPWKLNIFVETR